MHQSAIGQKLPYSNTNDSLVLEVALLRIVRFHMEPMLHGRINSTDQPVRGHASRVIGDLT